MRHPCMLGCGRLFSSMESAERHEEACSGAGAIRYRRPVASRTDDACDVLRDAQREERIAEDERRSNPDEVRS